MAPTQAVQPSVFLFPSKKYESNPVDYKQMTADPDWRPTPASTVVNGHKVKGCQLAVPTFKTSTQSQDRKGLQIVGTLIPSND